ncbi:fatty acid synthase-like [Coccinella septempunctata]|uniref:fatty acid synthase-like n=1 Tax=Coccinella septempunctata TaxID=41139 RepID=UPI001D07B136|nr:fatty acid synthase-like [Coccinella septempunctata]
MAENIDSDVPEKEISDTSLLNGRFLANPPEGEEICITGLSGVFPNSRDVEHYKDNLMQKIDMIDGDFRRWHPIHPEIPQRTGKIYDIGKFDTGFFGIHHRQANTMDPMARIILEKTVEAIFDAGLHPSELEGTKTGVFVGVCFAESEREIFFEFQETQNFAMTGCMRSMMTNRLSYFLKLKGPSMVTDTACSSSLYALEHAYNAMRNGLCDMAIVGGSNLCLHPFVSLQFARLGVLSADGCCKSFDNAGNGYCRSEAISCVLLQKSKDARRIYSTIVHAKTGCDGYKEQGITYPSGEMQKKLLEEFYSECGVDPRSLSFLEAHGTGTKVGDPEELTAIDEVFRPTEEKPLLIGSVKSNIGHSEPASGLCSVAKCIIGFEEGTIPPNLHYTTPREGVKALEEGRIKVVSEKTRFPDDNGLIGINSFGFGGGNCHVLLKHNTKLKKNSGQPSDDLPRLVCVSGRVPEAIKEITEDIAARKLDAEYIQLLHEIFKEDIECHNHRGFAIASKKEMLETSSRWYDGERVPLVLALGYFDKDWKVLAKDLLEFPVFAQTIQKIDSILYKRSISIQKILENSKKPQKSSEYVLEEIVGNVALQIGITNLLKHIRVDVDFVIGYAVGEIASGYFDDCLTLEEAVLMSYCIGLHLGRISKPSSTLVVKGRIKEMLKEIPGNIEIIWRNSEDIVTLSGDPGELEKFAVDLERRGAEILANYGRSEVTVHTNRIRDVEGELLRNLLEILPKPKQRSTKWISASTSKVASADYFVKALQSQIYHQELDCHFGKKQLVLEIGKGGFSELLDLTVKGTTESISFGQDIQGDGVLKFLKVIGRIYERGFNPKIQNLYPAIQYPVSRGTPMISPRIKWDHSQDWHVLIYKEAHSMKNGERLMGINPAEEDWQFLSGHVVDGRNLFPATGYLYVIWDTLSMINSISELEMVVVFEGVRLKRATPVHKQFLEFDVMIQRNSGKFEIIEGGVDIVSGTVRSVPNDEKVDFANIMIPMDPDECILKTKDVYKELRLRGYNYKGAFRGIQEVNCDATRGFVKWEGNWVTFMDNMMQLRILQLDTRLLYVPTGIEKMIIDPKRHLEYVESFGENPILPVYISKDSGVIKCGGIEIRGLKASSIPRRKQRSAPVLEKYQFVPNRAKLTIEESLRVNMQLGLENFFGIKLKIVEVLDEATKEDSEPLGPKIYDVYADLPLIQVNISVFTKETLELSNVTVENKELRKESDCHLVVGTKILQRAMLMQQAFSALKERAFVLSREDLDFDPSSMASEDLAAVDILTIHDVGTEKLVYFRKTLETKERTIIKVSEKDEEFRWLPSLQSALKNDKHVLVYAQNEPLNGLMGLFNCARREPGGNNIVCVLIYGEEAPPFDPEHPFYKEQLSRHMAINIYKDGAWGTYRHFSLSDVEQIDCEHSFVCSMTRGDMSSLRWLQGELNSKVQLPPEKTLINIYYAALNFRDVMTTSGRINSDVITMDRTLQECVEGFEFSGRDSSGKRVMGMVVRGALSTMIAADNYLLMDVPDCWSLEEAATLPVVYGTIIHALKGVGKMKNGETVLIHSGTGGVGQAAINFALCFGCNVFTTVGTPEKKKLLKELFPQLKESHIGNSRDTSFEKMVKQRTGGRGVDIVLNSLAEDKQQASIRCLAKGGRFLEIGKFDLASNNSLCLKMLERNCSFHGIMLDQFFTAHPSRKKMFGEILTKGIADGSIKPLQTTVFKMNEVEQAFRHMASGKHTGKVLIKIQDEENQKDAIPPVIHTKAKPRFTCEADKAYVITGGLGGFGLELADWLIMRGAKRILLTSRTGVQNGYQEYRLKTWKTYGATIKISTADITTKEGCDQLITEAKQLGPIESIFNLAVVLRDALLENQSPEGFRISFGPKSVATKHLDEITRLRCPELRDFVVFSSVSCGRGNAGQTNYGMANSIMERICEKRRKEGYPALAIQWGAVGDVGLVAEMMEEQTEMEIGGTLQQRITSCLQVMDTFLRQKEASVVASMLVAEKRSGSGGADNIVDAVANILGIKKQSVSPHATLSELGMDSMTAVEIKQVLEREFEVFLTAQDIRSMTFARLQEIQETKEKDKESGKVTQRLPRGFELILRYLGDENTSTIPVLRLPSLVEDDPEDVPYIFCFPGIEGFATSLKPLVANIKAKIIGIQFCYKNPTNSYKDLARESEEQILKYVSISDPVHMITYSWGTIIALETMSSLEKKGYKGTITCIDGAPDMLAEMCKQEMKTGSEAEFETIILCHLMAMYLPYDIILKNREKIYRCGTFDERLLVAHKISAHDATHSPQYQKKVAVGFHTRLKELRTYEPDYPKIMSAVRLFKPSTLSVQNFAEDYNLSRLCANLVEVRLFEGNHITILDNPSVAEAINEILGLTPKTPEITVQTKDPSEV